MKRNEKQRHSPHSRDDNDSMCGLPILVRLAHVPNADSFRLETLTYNPYTESSQCWAEVDQSSIRATGSFTTRANLDPTLDEPNDR